MKIILKDGTELTIISAVEEYNSSYLDQPEIYADINLNDDLIDLADIITIFSQDNISKIAVVNDLGQSKELSEYSKVKILRRNYSSNNFGTLVRLVK
jgi:uncharacterized Rmd1/YagE family protein